MRITLTLDDALAQELREIAHRTGKSFDDIVSEILREGLRSIDPQPSAKPYHLETVSLGVREGVNLDKALSISDAIEDEQIIARMLKR